jgi:hydroxymethylpyrimidine pyrophosphatase-like HAD family hydrolase
MLELIVTDIDGTLILDDTQPALPPALAAILERHVASGGRWVIATGRDRDDVEALLPRLEVRVPPDALVVNDGAVHLGGASGYSPWAGWNDARIERRRALFEREELRLSAFRAIFERRGLKVWQPLDAPWGIEARADDLDVCSEVAAIAWSDVPELVLARNGCWAAPAPRGDNKGASVRALAGTWGIAAARTVVAGDDLNDLSMMSNEVAHHWIAPANAVKRVREHVVAGGFVAGGEGPAGVVQGLLELAS